MPHANPLPAARANGAQEPESRSRSLTAGGAQPFLTDVQRAALDAALAVKLTTLTTGEPCLLMPSLAYTVQHRWDASNLIVATIMSM